MRPTHVSNSDDDIPTPRKEATPVNPFRKIAFGGALAGTAFLGGALGASLIGTANAQTNTDSTATTTPSSSTSSGTSSVPTPPPDPGTPDWSKGGHQANGITETVLTGDQLTKATAAAEAAEPGASAQRAETDAEGATYEVHMTKADGSIVTVKLDASFNVTETIGGMG